MTNGPATAARYSRTTKWPSNTPAAVAMTPPKNRPRLRIASASCSSPLGPPVSSSGERRRSTTYRQSPLAALLPPVPAASSRRTNKKPLGTGSLARAHWTSVRSLVGDLLPQHGTTSEMGRDRGRTRTRAVRIAGTTGFAAHRPPQEAEPAPHMARCRFEVLGCLADVRLSRPPHCLGFAWLEAVARQTYEVLCRDRKDCPVANLGHVMPTLEENR